MTEMSKGQVASETESVARRRVAALGVVLVSMYGPMLAWLLFMPETWSDRRWSYIGMIPILPGLVPGSLLAEAFEKSMTTAWLLAGGFSLLLVMFFWWLASIGRRFRLVVGLLIFIVSSGYAFLLNLAWT